MTGADLLIKKLADSGVEYIFGYPGDETAIFESLIKTKIRFITTRHEQGAAFMADAYARIKGKIGVCYSTLGPGATNLLTGIANAFLDRTPVIAFSDQVELKELHKGAHQYLDLSKMYEPVTKLSTIIESTEMIPQIISQAIDIATKERPGPVHITIPRDVLRSDVYLFPDNRKSFSNQPEKLLNKKLLKEIADLLNTSKKPVMIIGNLVNRKRLNLSVQKFIEKYSIPIFTTYMGKGAIPEDHPLSLGVISRHAKNQLAEIFEKSDLILLVGYDYAEGVKPDIWKVGIKKHVISFDDNYHTDGIFYKPDIIVDKLENETFRQLTPKATINHTDPWINVKEYKKQIIAKIRSKAIKHKNVLIPEEVMDAVSALSCNWIVTSDVGLNKYAVGLCLKTNRPNSVLFSNGLSSMGFSLPAALGAKFADPYSTVISISGDGGFMMNLQELETCNRYGLKIIFIIFKDNHLGLIKRLQISDFSKHIGVEIGNPDYEILAKAFNFKGVKVSNKIEFAKILNSAVKSKQSWIIEVPITYESWLE